MYNLKLEVILNIFRVTSTDMSFMVDPIISSVRAWNLKPLQDRFSFLVLLAFLLGSLICPTDNRPTFHTEDVRNSMQSGHHHPLFLRSKSDVHYLAEEISFTMPAVKWLDKKAEGKTISKLLLCNLNVGKLRGTNRKQKLCRNQRTKAIVKICNFMKCQLMN